MSLFINILKISKYFDNFIVNKKRYYKYLKPISIINGYLFTSYLKKKINVVDNWICVKIPPNCFFFPIVKIRTGSY